MSNIIFKYKLYKIFFNYNIALTLAVPMLMSLVVPGFRP